MLRGYRRFWGDFRAFRRMGGDATLRLVHPVLVDWDAGHPFDPHYFFQLRWALERIRDAAPEQHVDVASDLRLIAALMTVTAVTFTDIRPVGVAIAGLAQMVGSVVALPIADRSVVSLSCIHAAEHIGLGRYGDPIDPSGTRRAAAELSRVVAPGGRLYFGLPVGRPRIEFNAHRVHAVAEVPELFPELVVREVSLITDSGEYHEHAGLDGWEDQGYALGLYQFVRPR
jgi:SAM-dependent methyltransferase